MNSLDLEAAAAFLGLHPHTLQARAKAGEIPGAKPGKEWRFLDVDLADYLRSQYPAKQQREEAGCHSTGSGKSGTTTSSEMGGEPADPVGGRMRGLRVRPPRQDGSDRPSRRPGSALRSVFASPVGRQRAPVAQWIERPPPNEEVA